MDLLDQSGEITLDHEILHAAMEMALNAAEKIQLRKTFGNEEKAAQAFGSWRLGRETKKLLDGPTARLFQKIKDFWDRMVDIVPGIDRGAAKVFRQIESGKVFNRPVRKPKPTGQAFSIKQTKASRDKIKKLEAKVPGLKNHARYLTDSEIGDMTQSAAVIMVNTMKILPSTNEAVASSKAGIAKRGWYANSKKAIDIVFGKDGPRFSALLGALSPQTSVQDNLINALEIWGGWVKAGRPTDRQGILKVADAHVQKDPSNPKGGMLPAWNNNTVRALTEAAPAELSGPKVNSFTKNLTGNLIEVTNDAWMANWSDIDQNLFGGKTTDKNPLGHKRGGYLAMNSLVRKAGEESGLQPAEIQETVWSLAITLYGKADGRDESRSMEELIEQGAFTHEDVMDSPSFDVLLQTGRYGDIVERIGLGGKQAQLDLVDTQTRPSGDVTQGMTVATKNLLKKTAKRLDGLRGRRKKEAARSEILINLTAATQNIPGLAALTEQANAGDRQAATILQEVATNHLKLLTGKIKSAKVKYNPTLGLYNGQEEPSLGVSLEYAERDTEAVLAALVHFAEAHKQEQIHVRTAPTQKNPKIGTAYPDGSFNTPVRSLDLKRALTRDELQRIIDESELAGFTVQGDSLLAYYIGDHNDRKAIDQFKAAVSKAHKLLGSNVRRVGRRVDRIWVYGSGYGATQSYDAIRGHVPGKREDTASPIAQRVASRLSGRDVQPTDQHRGKDPQRDSVQKEIQTRIAEAYAAAPVNAMDDPDVRRAYDELVAEVTEQYDALPVQVELKFIPKGESVEEAYKDSAAMRRDVNYNNHLMALATDKDTFGPNPEFNKGHPLLANSGRKDINGKPLLANDMFRVVHDYFAHTMSPVEFGPRGEEAAWRNHMMMTKSPWARWALTTETRGQNSWVNFSKGRQELKVSERGFAEQKAALLPIEFVATGDTQVDANLAALPTAENLALQPTSTDGPKFSIRRNKTKQAAIIAKAKKVYGLTKDIDQAGLILPNGEMVDLKRNSQRESIEHEDAAKELGYKGETALFQFLWDSGAMRISVSDGRKRNRNGTLSVAADVSGVPTDIQKKILAQVVNKGRPDHLAMEMIFDRDGGDFDSTFQENARGSAVAKFFRAVPEVPPRQSTPKKRFSIRKRDPVRQKELQAQAVEKYGTTADGLNAGFITTDGQMIKMKRSVGIGKRGFQEHSDVAGALGFKEITEGVHDLLQESGMMRMGFLDIGKRPGQTPRRIGFLDIVGTPGDSQVDTFIRQVHKLKPDEVDIGIKDSDGHFIAATGLFDPTGADVRKFFNDTTAEKFSIRKKRKEKTTRRLVRKTRKKKENIKGRIRRATGQVKDATPANQSERQALQGILKAAESASKRGFRAGQVEVKANLSNAIKFVKEHVPTSLQSKVIAALKGTETPAGREHILNRVNDLQEQFEHGQALKKLEKTIKSISGAKANKLLPEFREKTGGLLGGLSLKMTSRAMKLRLDKLVKAAHVGAEGTEQISEKKFDSIMGRLDEADNKPIRELNTDSIRELDKALTLMVQLNRLKKKLVLGGQIRDFLGFRAEIIDGLRAMKSIKLWREPNDPDLDPKKGLFRDWVDSTLGPVEMAERIMGKAEGAFKKIFYDDVKSAQRQYLEIRQQAADMLRAAAETAGLDWNGESIENLSRSTARRPLLGKSKVTVKEIKLSSGETIRMTPAELIFLYNSLRDLDTQEQILNAGIVFKDKDIMKRTNAFDLSDLPKVKDAMSDAELILADVMSTWMNTIGKDHTTEIFKEMGESRELRDDYWPRRRSKNKVPENIALASVGNMVVDVTDAGVLKERTGSGSPVVVDDAFLLYFSHIDTIARTRAYAMPIRNMKMVLGDVAIKRHMTRVFGEQILKYWINRLVVLSQAGTNYAGSFDQATNNILQGFSKAVLGWNPSPRMKQFGGLWTAGDTVGNGVVLNWGKTFSKGDKSLKNIIKEVEDLSPEIRERYAVHAASLSSNIFEDYRPMFGRQKFTDKTLNGLQKSDMRIVAAIYLSSLEKTKGNKEEAARLTEKTVNHSQNITSEMDMSQFALETRQGGVFKKSLVLFKSNAERNANMMRQAGWRWNKSDKTAEDNKALAATLTRVMVGQAGTSVVVGMLMRTLKNIIKGDAGDDDETIFEKSLLFFKDLVLENLGQFYVVDTVADMVDAAFSKKFWWRTAAQGPIEGVFVDAVDAAAMLYESMESMFNNSRFESGPHRGQSKAGIQAIRGLTRTSQVIFTALGLPLFPLRMTDAAIERLTRPPRGGTSKTRTRATRPSRASRTRRPVRSAPTRPVRSR